MRVYALLLALCLVGLSAPAAASTYIPLGNEVYDLLSRLEAEGVVQTGLLSTKPISRNEALRLLREAEEKADQTSLSVRSLVEELKARLRPGDAGETGQKDIKPIDRAYAGGVYLDRADQTPNYNNNGDVYEKGWNFRFGVASRMDDIGRFSFYVNPELRTGRNDTDIDYLAAYGVFDFGWDLVAGKDSLWWGPGYHGSILLSNNAEPFTMLRITNPEPVKLPWLFRHLGPFGFTFFVTQLEKSRNDVPEPYLYGLRLSFKPHAGVEIGLHKTAILGGGNGRPEDLTAWGKSLLAIGDRDNRDDQSDPGDQRAGGDIKLTLPFRVQPVQLYAEFDGEDENKNVPIEWAYVTGLYLPRILSLDRVEFRFEFASTSPDRKPDVWYRHHIYTDGYTYKGRIIGHHIGSNARDVFGQVTYRVPERNARISLWYDVEEHGISKPVVEKRDETGLRAVFSPLPELDVNLAYAYGRVENPGNVSADTINVSQSQVWVEMRF